MRGGKYHREGTEEQEERHSGYVLAHLGSAGHSLKGCGWGSVKWGIFCECLAKRLPSSSCCSPPLCSDRGRRQPSWKKEAVRERDWTDEEEKRRERERTEKTWRKKSTFLLVIISIRFFIRWISIIFYIYSSRKLPLYARLWLCLCITTTTIETQWLCNV